MPAQIALFDPTKPTDDAFRAAVGATLDAFWDAKLMELTAISPLLSPLVSVGRSYTTGGKRLRPAFAYWGYVAISGEPAERTSVIAAASAFELLHVGILMHDDLIDASDTRRGLPAAHHAFAALHREQAGIGDSADFGAAAAIVLGDEMILWADEVLASAQLPVDVLSPALQYWRAVRTEVNAGQFLDIANQYGLTTGLDAREAARLVLEIKTARYTVVRPLQFGAALAGADHEVIDGLARFASPTGRAFQLRDDLLGVFADEAETGKPSGGDLKEGKQTLLLAEALESSAHADELRTLIGHDDLDDRELDRARELITDSGAVDRIEEEINRDVAEATAALAALDLTPEGRTALEALLELSVQRRS